MAVGQQLTKTAVDNTLTALAVNVRNTMNAIREQQTPIQNMGVAGLTALGYSSAPNAANPGGVSDAQFALNLFGYLSTVAGVYFGTVQQGGTGGTGASLFNFDSGLSAVWAGQ